MCRNELCAWRRRLKTVFVSTVKKRNWTGWLKRVKVKDTRERFSRCACPALPDRSKAVGVFLLLFAISVTCTLSRYMMTSQPERFPIYVALEVVAMLSLGDMVHGPQAVFRYHLRQRGCPALAQIHPNQRQTVRHLLVFHCDFCLRFLPYVRRRHLQRCVGGLFL